MFRRFGENLETSPDLPGGRTGWTETGWSQMPSQCPVSSVDVSVNVVKAESESRELRPQLRAFFTFVITLVTCFCSFVTFV